MKHKLLPPLTSVGFSQTLTFRSHSFYRFGRLLSFTLLVFFALMPFSKSKAQYCSSASITETCNTAKTLNATNFPAWSYTWFETNASGGSPVPLNGGAPAAAITVAPTQTTYDEIHYYIEVGNRLYAPFLTCTSGVKAVKFTYELPIVSNGSSSPTFSISTSTTITYTNYQWYKNNSLIVGATASTYSPSCSGIYTLHAKNSCNNVLISNTITYNASNTQCNSSTASYSTCNNSYTLNYASTSCYDVTWYECDNSGNNGSILNNGNPTNSISVSPSSITSQKFYYYYKCTDKYTNATCSSGVITVNFDHNLNITSNNGVTLPATLSANSTNASYSSYQWYRNGQIIVGANLSYYNASLPGDYYMTCTSSTCGNSTSNTISFCGNNTYATNYTFPTGAHTYSYTTLILDGTITIPPGADITFDNANIYMKGCSQILVKSSNTNNIGKLTITNSSISSCALWSGIIVEGNLATPGELVLYNAEIRDATIGIYADYNSKLNIQNSLFEDNLSHLALFQLQGSLSTFTNNEFSFLKSSITGCSNLPVVHSLLNNSTPRMILIDQCINVKFTEAKLYPNTIINTADINGIESYDCKFPIGPAQPSGTKCVWLNQCEFNGVFTNGAYFDNGQVIVVDGLTSSVNFNGDFKFGVNLHNCINSKVQNQKFTFSGSSNTTKTAIKCYQSNGLDIIGNAIDGFQNGIEYYSNQGSQAYTEISLNYIHGNDIGIVLAPEEYPVGASHSQSSNGVNKMTDFIIECNKIYYNNYGIVGFGEIADQPVIIAGSPPEWGNWFGPNGNGAVSTSAYADFVYLLAAGASKAQISHYDVANVSAPLKYFTSTNNYSLQIEGCTVAYNGSYKILDQFALNPTSSYNTCWNSFKTDPLVIEELTTKQRIDIAPNPFSDIIKIQNLYDEQVNYIIYNALGEIVKQGTLQTGNKEMLFMGNMASGCYYIKTYDQYYGHVLNSNKLIKTN